MSELFDLFSGLHDQTAPKESRDKDVIRAPFGYPGGKDKSFKIINDILPEPRDKWLDLCGGSGIMTLNRQRSKILDVYNDRWSGVTAFFRCVRSEEKYLKLLDSINMSMHSRDDFVFAKSNWENPKVDDVERATLFYLMMSHSFGKLGRNWARSLNAKVSFKRNVDIQYWTQLHARFAECQIENMDLVDCSNEYDSIGTIHYYDPPYLNTDSGIYKCKFNLADHHRFLKNIFENVKGYVAVSAYKNEEYAKYPWDDVHVWEVKVSMDSRSSTEGGNREYNDVKMASAIECLYIKEESK